MNALRALLSLIHHPGHAGPTAVLLLSGLIGAPVGAQQETWVPELPGTRDSGTSARAMGLGGAYLALSDDAGALRYNPAGLARITRIEFSGGLVDRRIEQTNVDRGVESQAELTRTRLTALGFVYPFPTYRGSMVIGLGYSVPHITDREYLRAGPREAGDLEESIFEEGTIGEWSFGYAIDVGPALALGLRTSLITGSFYQFWTYEDPAWPDIRQETDTQVGGFTASLGAQARLGDWGRLGLVLDLPRWLSLETEVLDEDGQVYQGEDEDVTLPFSVGAGLAGFAGPLLLAADLRLTDWTQADYEGPLRYVTPDGRREFAYRRTLDLHVGAEFLIDLGPRAGLRLRGGVAYEPVPYGVVFTDITPEGDPVYHEADFDPDRLSLSMGLGVLAHESLTVDLAYVTGSFTREGGELSEETDERRLLVAAAFRLD